MEAIALGLYEALDEHYLQYRIRSIAYLGERVRSRGADRPTDRWACGLHGCREMLPHIPALQYPAWSLNNALYLVGGVRGVEIGSVMFGLQPDGSEKPGCHGAGAPGIPTAGLHPKPRGLPG